MSDREQKILAELEDEFRPSPASVGASRWSVIDAAKRLAAGAVAAALGLVLLAVGVILANGAGIVLSMAAYLLVVGGACTAVGCAAGRREIRRLKRTEDRHARRHRR